MLWKRSGIVVFLRSVSWVCLTTLLVLSTSVGSAHCETPLRESWPVVAETDSTITILIAEYEFLLADRAYLKADLHECETRLGHAKETPPECKSVGVPLWTVFAAALVGAVAAAAVN